MTRTEHARRALRARIEKLDGQIDLALKHCGEDEVHDFRVAVRRLSQALRVFAELFPGKEARKMRKALKPALDAAAHVRDLDVDSELLVRLGLRRDHPLLEKMRSDRERGALGFLGHLYLLRSQGAPRDWLGRLEMLRETEEDAAEHARGLLPPLAAEFFLAGRKAALKPSARCLFTVLNGFAMARRHSNEDVAKNIFDPLGLTELSDVQPRPLAGGGEMRERGFVPTELTLLFQTAGLQVLNIWGGTAGNWGRRPVDLDEMEIMVLACKAPDLSS